MRGNVPINEIKEDFYLLCRLNTALAGTLMRMDFFNKLIQHNRMLAVVEVA